MPVNSVCQKWERKFNSMRAYHAPLVPKSDCLPGIHAMQILIAKRPCYINLQLIVCVCVCVFEVIEE